MLFPTMYVTVISVLQPLHRRAYSLGEETVPLTAARSMGYKDHHQKFAVGSSAVFGSAFPAAESLISYSSSCKQLGV